MGYTEAIEVIQAAFCTAGTAAPSPGKTLSLPLSPASTRSPVGKETTGQLRSSLLPRLRLQCLGIWLSSLPSFPEYMVQCVCLPPCSSQVLPSAPLLLLPVRWGAVPRNSYINLWVTSVPNKY